MKNIPSFNGVLADFFNHRIQWADDSGYSFVQLVVPSPRCVNQECGGCEAVYTVLGVYSSHKYPNEQEPGSVLSRLNMTCLCATLILTTLTRNIPSTEDTVSHDSALGCRFMTRRVSVLKAAKIIVINTCTKKVRYIHVCRIRLAPRFPPGRSSSRSRSRVTPRESWQQKISRPLTNNNVREGIGVVDSRG